LYSERGDCSDLLLEETFEYEAASARILGRDVSLLLTDESRALVEQALSSEADAAGARALAMTMVRNNANYHGEFDMALARLSNMRQGVMEIKKS
jgi:hypothetical protein